MFSKRPRGSQESPGAGFLLFGILLTVLGVVCIGKAQTATTFSILALGWVLAISGVLWLVNSF